jgi:hypothetical protein
VLPVLIARRKGDTVKPITAAPADVTKPPSAGHFIHQSQMRFGLPQAAVEILIIKELDIVSVVRCVLLMG